MDELAAHMSARGWRVICPDTIGRGLSQWAVDPHNEYRLAFYARIAADLMDRLQVDEAHWVGTSMGGAIGTVCAAGLFQPQLKGRIKSLVLNDNAPRLAAPAVERIKAYAGSPPAFATIAELESFFRQVYKPYGWLSDAQWRRLTETSTRRLPDGRVTPHYDPQMVQQFIAHPDDYLQWDAWDSLDLPVNSAGFDPWGFSPRDAKIYYTLVQDQSDKADQAAVDADVARLRKQFEGALANMKKLAEG